MNASMPTSFREFNGRVLVWIREALTTNSWKLVSRGQTFATLTFHDSFNSSATLQTDLGAWEIGVTFGGVAQRIAVSSAATGEEIAILRPSSQGGGRIDFIDGAAFRWRGPATTAAPARITTIKNGPILTIGKPIGATPGAVTLELDAEAGELPESSLLTGLALYNSLRQVRDEVRVARLEDPCDRVALAG